MLILPKWLGKYLTSEEESELNNPGRRIFTFGLIGLGASLYIPKLELFSNVVVDKPLDYSGAWMYSRETERAVNAVIEDEVNKLVERWKVPSIESFTPHKFNRTSRRLRDTIINYRKDLDTPNS